MSTPILIPHREAILTEGEIANLPPGTALLLRTGQWRLLTIERHFESRCWLNVQARGPREISPDAAAVA